MPDTAPTLSDEFSAALEWWRAAGVDYDYSDDATAWLVDGVSDEPAERNERDSAERARVPTKGVERETQKSPPRTDLLGDSPPASLDEFRTFWLQAPGLDTIGPRGRVPPRGPAEARLMVLVIDPEQQDSDVLLSGQQGQLLANFLAAAGIDQDEVYFASALPRHTPMADTAPIAAGGMDAIVAHHISLARPERVLAFGANILPLLGHNLTKDIHSLREINQGASRKPLLVSEGLDSLMSMPRLKARLWRRWNEWSAEL